MKLCAVPAFKAVFPIQPVADASCALREMLALRIGVAAHSVERQFCHGKRHGFVEIHVLHKTSCIEEIISLPMRRQCGECCIAELRIDLVAASEDDILVIPLEQ